MTTISFAVVLEPRKIILVTVTPSSTMQARSAHGMREMKDGGAIKHGPLALLASDQVIRENPASRGTETSAENLVGPPWRMESNAGQQQYYYYYYSTATT